MIQENVYAKILEATNDIQSWALDCESNFDAFFGSDGSYGEARMGHLQALNFQNIRCIVEAELGNARNSNKLVRQNHLGQCLMILKSIAKAIEKNHGLRLYESFWELHLICECAYEEESYLYRDEL